MSKHKQYIFEWGGVNSSVLKASKSLLSAIWSDSLNKPQYFSVEKNKPYLEGEFLFNFDEFDDGENYRITYTIYIVDDLNEYNELFMNAENGESSNSSSDFIEKRINIVSGIIGGEMSPDFFSNVMHEVDHIFEYSKGLKKNEPLYKRIMDGINSDNDAIRCVSILMYYGFKSEQDAFVHEFYATLAQNKYDGDFKTALWNLSEYANLMTAYKNVIHGEIPRENIVNACKELGTSFEHILRFFNYIKKKMENKLFKAYTRYVINKSKNKLFEGLRRSNKIKHFIFFEYKKRYKNLEIKEEKFVE